MLDRRLSLLRHRRQRLVEAARGGGLDQMTRLTAARGRGTRRQVADLGGALGDEDRAPDGDADRDTDLTEGVVDPRGHTAPLLRHDAQCNVTDDRVQQTDASAEDEE